MLPQSNIWGNTLKRCSEIHLRVYKVTTRRQCWKWSVCTRSPSKSWGGWRLSFSHFKTLFKVFFIYRRKSVKAVIKCFLRSWKGQNVSSLNAPQILLQPVQPRRRRLPISYKFDSEYSVSNFLKQQWCLWPTCLVNVTVMLIILTILCFY